MVPHVYFLELGERPSGDPDLRRCLEAAASVAGTCGVDAFTPVASNDPFLDGGDGPALVLALRFEGRARFERAITNELYRVLDAVDDPSVAVHEAFELESFAVPESTGSPGLVSYLVSYHRPAEDEAAFIAHYRAHHPAIMRRFPGLRSLELGYPVDLALPATVRRADRMLFCEVSFDTRAALDAALASDVRRELRRDFESFPPFSGAVTHFAMMRSGPG